MSFVREILKLFRALVLVAGVLGVVPALAEPTWGGRSSALLLAEMQYDEPGELPTHTPSFSESWERKPWGEDSFIQREVSIFRGSIEDIRQEQMHLSALHLVLFRLPASRNFAFYGENVFQIFAYPQHDSRVSPTLERRSVQLRSSIGLEWVYRNRIRVRFPIFFEQKQYRRWDSTFGPIGQWRHGIWLSPQIAVQTGPESELLFTTSTLSFVNADFSKVSFKDGFTTHWYQVLLRTAL